MIEILCLLIGFIGGFLVSFNSYYNDLKHMTAEQIKEAIDEIEHYELSYQQQAQQQSKDDEMELSSLNRAINKTHDV